MNLQSLPPGHILTNIGRSFNVIAPKAEDIDIKDIAYALSNLCRWGGHSRGFFSVAQHCITGTLRLLEKDPAHALQFLLHDASEAYLVDVPKPIKKLLPEYGVIESRLSAAIYDRFGFTEEALLLGHEAVEAMDKEMLNLEYYEFFVENSRRELKDYDRRKANTLFIGLFDTLYKK